MAVIYNELSAIPVFENKETANHKVANFVNTFIAAKEHGFRKIRFTKSLHEIEIAEKYTLVKWLEDTNQRNLKDILLEARDYPEYDPSDLWCGEKYLISSFSFENKELKYEKVKCFGLAAAYLYKTLSISFDESAVWKKNKLSVIETNEVNHEVENVIVRNVFSPACLDNEDIKAYIKDSRPIALAESGLAPAQKKVHLSDHHGKKELEAFSKRLKNNVFIVEIKSTNWGGKELIRKVHSDGKIELVLYWTQREYALLIQTTGKSQRETEEIARQLKEQFD